MLSTTDKVNVHFECLKNDIDHMMNFTTADLKDASETYISQLTALIARVMDSAGLQQGVRVEGIGNGWRSPVVAAAIKEAAGNERLGLSLDSNMAVAEGACCVGVIRNRSAAATGAASTEPAAVTPTAAAASTAEVVHGVVLKRATAHEIPNEAPVVDAARIEAWSREEARLFAIDEVHRRQVNALNEFESVLFQTKDVATAARATDAKSTEELNARLSAEENWLYDARDGLIEGFNTDMIQDRLAKLRKDIEEKFPQVAAHRAELAAKEKAKEDELSRLARENTDEKEYKSDPQRLKAAHERREQGANLFKQEHFQEAQTRFVQALGILGDLYDYTGENKVKKDEISLSCHLNIASCCVKLGLWKIAANNCTKALEIKPDHPKALYRRGQAQAQLGELTAAKEDLERALELSGGDAAVAAELEAVKQRMAAAKEKEKKMFSKMFT
jgi:tetratricopeptide (TPR) repeat protein